MKLPQDIKELYTQEMYDADVSELITALAMTRSLDEPDDQDMANAWATLTNLIDFKDSYWMN